MADRLWLRPLPYRQPNRPLLLSGSTPDPAESGGTLSDPFFTILAFLLATVGLYGIVAYSVARRTEELGIRMALGAARADILRLVVGEGLTLTGAGILVGVIGSLDSNRLLSAWLYETSVRDPLTHAPSALLFTAVAPAASYWPARRAARIDPVEALRAE